MSVNLPKPTKFIQTLLSLIIVEGLFANIVYFSGTSETQNSFLWGYSLRRLAIGSISITLVILFTGLLLFSILKMDVFQLATRKLISFFGNRINQIIFFVPISLILAFATSIILINYFPILFNLVSFISIKRSVLRETGIIQIWTFLLPLQIWLILIGIKALIFFIIMSNTQKNTRKQPSTLSYLTIFICTIFVTISFMSILWIKTFRAETALLVTGPPGKLALLSLWFLFGAWIEKHGNNWLKKQTTLFICISIWLFTFLYSAQLSQWMDSLNTPFKNYWNWLADAFLHGRLYLIDPPSMGDMTLHNGRIYIPIPPLPAILMMPFIAIWGVNGFNTTIFSITISALTSVLVFLSLKELANRKWIQLSLSGILWLVALFSLGTVHLWLSISSVVWYFSQICTVFFVALAFTLALKQYPAWLTGLSLATAILARPNVFVIWPALLFITVQIQAERHNSFRLAKIFSWAAWAALPMFISAGVLLYYNYLRFGNFLDFGYADLYGSIYVMENVKKYGMFNPHFIPINLKSILPILPSLASKCEYYFARGNGISMLAATPAAVYAFRRFKFSWWLAGCWSSVIGSLILLLMYHNNGAVQIAYRYILDFAVPLTLIIAYAAGKKISLTLKLLIITSVIVNYYAIISWYFGPC